MFDESTSVQGDTDAGAGAVDTGQVAEATVPAEAAPAPGVDTDAPQTDSETPAQAIEYGDFDYGAYPEGYAMDDSQTGAFKDLGKALGLNQEQMQQLVDFDAQRHAQLLDTAQSAQAEQVRTWEAEVKADQELGGAHLTETLAIASKAVEAFGAEGLKDYLDRTGLGNHPAMVRTFYAIGKAISEDTVITGKEPTSPPSAAHVLYPSMSQQAR